MLHGAQDQYIYGNDLGGLMLRAMKLVHHPVPTCTPNKVLIHIRTGGKGRNATWRLLQTIPAHSK